jgi:pimeloyl-ACP methyl ester carboxylesterase
VSTEYASHLTTANGTTIAWYELGDGPPLVLLHGLADSHRTWRFVAPQLAKHFHVYMLDLPGHGLSARPPDAPYTLPWYADTVLQWMDAVGLERAHICGHSYGGGIAQWMLLENRHRINRLALVAAGGLGKEVGTLLRLAALPFVAPFLESRLFGPVSSLMMRYIYRSSANRDQLRRLVRWNGAPNSGLAFRRTVAACIGFSGQFLQTWQHIHKVKSLPPIAVFWGARDSIIPVSHAHDAAKRLGRLTMTIYPQCGHCLHAEEPDRFASDLSRFLLERGRKSARLLPELARAGAALVAKAGRVELPQPAHAR